MQSPILVILKPEVFDVELRNTNSDIFLPGVNFPEPDTLLSQLFE